MITRETTPEEGDANARNPDIDDSRQSAWQRLTHHGSWVDWSLPQYELGVYHTASAETKKHTEKQKSSHQSRQSMLCLPTYAQTLIYTARVCDVTASRMQRHSLIQLLQRVKCLEDK